MADYQPKKRYTVQFRAEVTYQIDIDCDTEHQALTTVQECEFDWDQLVETDFTAEYCDAEVVEEEDLIDDEEEEDED